MKKSKGEKVDLFYLDNKDSKKSSKKTKEQNKVKPKKQTSKTNKKVKTKGKEKKGSFSFEDEIVIGITKKPKNAKKNQNTKKKKVVKKDKQNKYANKTPKEIEKIEKRRKMISLVLKWSIFLIILLGALIYFMLSPVFNIKEVIVSGNSKLTKEQIISLSRIELDINMFKLGMANSEKMIKEESYIETVKISRKLPSIINIEIKERVPTYMLEFVNSYVLINNQGYILEIIEEKKILPIVTGYETKVEDIKVGGRLVREDLYKLETVLKIMETMQSFEIYNLVEKIDISNKNNFTLIIEEGKKTVYLGDASNINTRILYLKDIAEREKGLELEIFINGDMNKDKVYSREKM